MCNRLADELEQRIRDGVSVVPAGTKRILVTGTPMAVPNWKTPQHHRNQRRCRGVRGDVHGHPVL